MTSSEDIALIKEKINLLQQRVNTYDEKKGLMYILKKIKAVNISRIHIYIAIPIVVLISLLLSKPNIITKEAEGGEKKKKYSYPKLIGYTLLIAGGFIFLLHLLTKKLSTSPLLLPN